MSTDGTAGQFWSTTDTTDFISAWRRDPRGRPPLGWLHYANEQLAILNSCESTRRFPAGCDATSWRASIWMLAAAETTTPPGP